MKASNEKKAAARDARLAKALKTLIAAPMTIMQLAKKLGVGRLTAAKCIEELEGQGLLTHETLPRAQGGRAKVYRAKPGASFQQSTTRKDCVLPDAFMRAMVAHGRENRV